MRPLWERTMTWAVGDHLVKQGVGESAAYNMAALVVRDLDRRYGLTTILGPYTLVEPADVVDPEMTSPRFLAIVQAFWRSVKGPATSKAERNRLLNLALASMLHGGRAESAVSAQLALDARTIEAAYGKLGSGWETPGGEWNGFGALGIGTSDFGALRDEMVGTGSATVLTSFDRLVSAARERKGVVKTFQTWAKNLGWYDGRIDGFWGDKSEGAFARAVPMSVGRVSELRDVVPLRPAIGFVDAAAIAVLITRDLWLAEHPDKLVAGVAAAGDAVDSGLIEVSYPKAESTTATSISGGGSQVVVTYPKTTGASSASPTAYLALYTPRP